MQFKFFSDVHNSMMSNDALSVLTIKDDIMSAHVEIPRFSMDKVTQFYNRYLAFLLSNLAPNSIIREKYLN